MNNGIQLSVNYPGRVYVADTVDRSLNVFQWEREQVAFRRISRIGMEDGPDNTHVDPITKQYYIATVSNFG